MSKWVWEKGYVTKVVKKLNINRIVIVSAFFSEYGFELLRELQQKNSLRKESIIVYLSKDFSLKNPGELLEKLTQYATVNIVHRIKLHAKIFVFHTADGLRIFHGSANFTRGGLEDNLELTHEIESPEFERISEFIDHCHTASNKVGNELIQQYKDIEKDLEQYAKTNREASRKIDEIFIDNKDPFRESDYELDEYFFTFQDYETFFSKYQITDDPIIRSRRDNVRKKLFELNNVLKQDLSKINLHNHWGSLRYPELITSQIDRSNYNHNRLSWICLRYGKHKKNAKIGNGMSDRYESFIKHACMQVSIVEEGVQIGLYHATAYGAIDRDYLKGNIDRLKDDIQLEISRLKGEQFVWHIYDPKTDKSIQSFIIDQEDPKAFIDFYKTYDTEGYESFCIFHMPPHDDNLKSKASLVRIAKEKITKLHPLYQLITWIIPE